MNSKEKIQLKELTIEDIAREASVSKATVDRVVNQRANVKASTRERVIRTIQEMKKQCEFNASNKPISIAFIASSGASLCKLLSHSVQSYAKQHPYLRLSVSLTYSPDYKDHELVKCIYQAAKVNHALVLMVPEEPSIIAAVNEVSQKGIPVVCLATDLSHSRRIAYIGADQTCAGSTAAFILGKAMSNVTGRILLVVSGSFRGNEERELGFRRVMRSDFPNLIVDESINSLDTSECSYLRVKKYLQQHPDTLGIYNAAAGNRGIARAIKECELSQNIMFIAQEATTQTKALLETGEVDFILAHDLETEIDLCIKTIQAFLNNQDMPNKNIPLLIYTRYSQY